MLFEVESNIGIYYYEFQFKYYYIELLTIMISCTFIYYFLRFGFVLITFI